MTVRGRDWYLRQRRIFEPEEVRLAIVAESPPASGLYFYDPSGRITEPLFSALLRQIGYNPPCKADGLAEFRRQGWVLVDATYEPVNTMSAPERDRVILRDYPLLRADLEALTRKRAPLLLLKANVCRRLEAKLVGDGFNVLNAGRVVYFPSTGRQKAFERQFGEVVALAYKHG